MNYRLATVLAEKTLGTAGTETIDLNIQDPISRLEIAWQPTLFDSAMLAALAVGISKIELVDGSDVLHSLNGRENQALCIYDRRVPTMTHGVLFSGAKLHTVFGIDFGRYLYDPELAFDPTKFRNPQLKITHDSTLLSANTSVHTLEVLAHCFDERVISPVGFLMSKEHKSYTLPAAASYEYTDMPTDYPIRQILIRAYLTQVYPESVMDTVKLSEDNDKRIPLDIELTSYIRRMKGEWPLVAEAISDYVPHLGGYDKYVTPTGDPTVVTATGLGETSEPIELADFTKGGYVQWRGSNVAYIGRAEGYIPHHCIQLPFGRQDQIDDWYDVTRLGSLRLRLLSKAAGSGGTAGVVLQQLRRY